MSQKPLAHVLINHKAKHEWAMRENGSFEDAGSPENHVYNLISRPPHYRINIYSQAELDALISSGSYAGQAFGDTDEDIIRKEASIRRAVVKLNKITL